MKEFTKKLLELQNRQRQLLSAPCQSEAELRLVEADITQLMKDRREGKFDVQIDTSVIEAKLKEAKAEKERQRGIVITQVQDKLKTIPEKLEQVEADLKSKMKDIDKRLADNDASLKKRKLGL